MFIDYVNKCNPFWDEMDDLDAHTHVIDPLTPTFGDYHRRIMMPDKIIMNLTFDALRPRSLPEINFSGPEKLVDFYENIIDNNYKVLRCLFCYAYSLIYTAMTDKFFPFYRSGLKIERT